MCKQIIFILCITKFLIVTQSLYAVIENSEMYFLKYLIDGKAIPSKLAIEIGRYNKTDRIDRICYKCSHFVKDELHFILVRPSHIDYSRRFAKHYWEKPSMFKQF